MTDDAFRDLAIAELDAVFRLACHLSRNSQEAEDFVQETYLRAFRSASSFTLTEYGIRPWLFKILYNVIYASGSRNHREKSAIQDLQHERSAESHISGFVDCSSLNWEWVDQRLKSAIMDLPEQYRVVFLLSSVESLKYQEIANVIDVPIGTVMSRLARARAMLAERLKDLGAELGFKPHPPPTNSSHRPDEPPV